jgi:hypothetical protein
MWRVAELCTRRALSDRVLAVSATGSDQVRLPTTEMFPGPGPYAAARDFGDMLHQPGSNR